MKTKLLLASAAFSVLFVTYSARLFQAAENSQDPTTNDYKASVQTPVVVSDAKFVVPSLVAAGQFPRATYNRFVLNNRKPCELTGRKGTVLRFPAAAFVDESGNSVTDGIELIVDECYDIDEMLAEKLSTTSGSRIIETAGMVNIRALHKGESLRLRDGVSYSIAFPVQDERVNDFQLFYGKRNEQGIINWALADSGYTDNTDTGQSEAASIADDCFIRISASEFRRGNVLNKMDYFNWKLQDGQTLNQWFVSNFNPDAAMVNDFCVKRLYSGITFRVDESGRFKDYYISHASIPEYDRIIAELMMEMPGLDLTNLMPKYFDDHACALEFGHRKGLAGDDFVKRFAAKYDYSDPDQVMTNVNSSDLDFYMFNSTELGWINCDRFIEETAPLVDFHVDAPVDEGASVSMVFEDRKSILRGVRTGDGFSFTGIPTGSNVRLIAVNNQGGAPVMQVSKTNTSKKRCTMNQYEPLTLAALDAAMCWK